MSATLSAQCCVVGGGPAGLMAGFLLARAGVDVVVIEKHADFLRDFRGDTIHPSTLRLMDELGLLDEFLRLPHHKAYELAAWIGDRKYKVADFRSLPGRCNFIAFMPQWDFLDFIAAEARKLPNFRLLMRTAADDLLWDGDRVKGVAAADRKGAIDISADLVIAADGRGSRMRAAARLEVEDFGAPMDVLWFKLPRIESDPDETFGRVGPGRMFIMIDRGSYWQCGCVIPKGGAEELRQKGMEAFRASIAALTPFLADRVETLADWAWINLLTVQVNRLKTWSRPGLLCIGDAAHAMSPVGGVGVNLAIQDAVAAANLLAAKLRAGTLADDDLASVQRRREFPVRVTQRLQLAIQNLVIRNVLAADKPIEAPLALRLFDAIPLLRRLPARLIGLGVQPEHVQTQV
ncbi:FAD-dependent oxidoreductase [Methylocystis sp. 9N]|uniref:FAD-dependent oxidoreductase n=1 Tax=Methylocystis borbori TaxID=3118750 RepID=A0ABU7XDF3_9HYPH